MRPTQHHYSGHPYNNIVQFRTKRRNKQPDRLAELAWSLIAAGVLIYLVAIAGSITFPY